MGRHAATTPDNGRAGTSTWCGEGGWHSKSRRAGEGARRSRVGEHSEGGRREGGVRYGLGAEFPAAWRRCPPASLWGNLGLTNRTGHDKATLVG
jgi:hypothetical protein